MALDCKAVELALRQREVHHKGMSECITEPIVAEAATPQFVEEGDEVAHTIPQATSESCKTLWTSFVDVSITQVVEYMSVQNRTEEQIVNVPVLLSQEETVEVGKRKYGGNREC